MPKIFTSYPSWRRYSCSSGKFEYLSRETFNPENPYWFLIKNTKITDICDWYKCWSRHCDCLMANSKLLEALVLSVHVWTYLRKVGCITPFQNVCLGQPWWASIWVKTEWSAGTFLFYIMTKTCLKYFLGVILDVTA